MSRIEPPKWPLKFLRLICPDEFLEEIEGDILQQYFKNVEISGVGTARRKIIFTCIRFFRPGILFRNHFSLHLTPFYMLLHYFKSATRIFLRNRLFTAINISGLVLGLTSAILLLLWINNEFNYDQFHTDKELIFKAYNQTQIEGEIASWSNTPRILASTLVENYASVDKAVSYGQYGAAYLFTYNDKKLMKNSGIYTDPGFLQIFSLPLLHGNEKTALTNPNSLVITEEFAHQLFGYEEALGKTVTIREGDYKFNFTVTGILKSLLPHTDFNFEYIIPFSFLEGIEGRDDNWNNNSVQTFIKLKPGVEIADFNEEIKNITFDYTNGANKTEVFLYPFTRTHLYGQFENGVEAGGRIVIVKMLALLTVLLVVVASINFINLSTARAQKRSREIGVRKSTGAGRGAIATQFICESILYSFVAGIISVALAYLLLPAFNDLIQQKLTLQINDPLFWLIMISGFLAIGIMAGSYPALYLSSFSPVKAIKGVVVKSSGRNLFRQTLVVSQFGFAIMLIFSTVVIRDQIIFSQERDTGYEKKDLVYHFITGDLNNNYHLYRDELLRSGIATSVTKTNSPITEGWTNTWALEWNGKVENDKTIFDRFYVDQDITTTAGLTVLEGRDMDLTQYPSDSTAVLLNEAAVKAMGFDDAIGEVIMDNGTEWHVIGVVKDFILTSPTSNVQPMVLMGAKGWFTVIHIKLNPEMETTENIASIAKLFNKYNPDYPFNYFFVDVVYDKKFSSIQKTLTITAIFSSIAIAIACMGLFGLSLFLIEARLKEVGIRKVFGGSISGMVRKLSYLSLKPILLAILIFSPLGWISMNWWLQNYQYRIELEWKYLLYSAIIMLSMAFITILWQTIKAAMTNPVNVLRSE